MSEVIHLGWTTTWQEGGIEGGGRVEGIQMPGVLLVKAKHRRASLKDDDDAHQQQVG